MSKCITIAQLEVTSIATSWMIKVHNHVASLHKLHFFYAKRGKLKAKTIRARRPNSSTKFGTKFVHCFYSAYFMPLVQTVTSHLSIW